MSTDRHRRTAPRYVGDALYVLGVLLTAALGGCGESTAPEDIDVGHHLTAMRGHRPSGISLPSDARTAELYPNNPEPRRNGPQRTAFLRENQHARVLLDAGAVVVPKIVAALENPEQREAAALLLGEIGGEVAATGLLEAWRAVRDEALTVGVIPSIHELDFDADIGDDAVFCSAVVTALSFAGRPVSAAIATDTTTAIAEVIDAHKRGERVTWREQGHYQGAEVTFVRQAPSLDTAREGLTMLAMVGGAGLAPTFERALRSGVRELRHTALGQMHYIGRDATPLLPIVVAMLRDIDERESAHDLLGSLYMDVRAEPAAEDEQGWMEAFEYWRRRAAKDPIPTSSEL